MAAASSAARAAPGAGTTTIARVARVALVVALLAALCWLLAGRGLVNYDTLYTLVWGRDLAGGDLPDYDVSLAPTPHPLATLGAALLAPLSAASADAIHGEAALAATTVLAFMALGLLGVVVYALGAAWFNPAAGVLAAAIVLTRRPFLDFGARAYVDVPYLVLVLAALLVETRRSRAGAPVLALLALAGLVRPEAWLFSAVYLVWLIWTPPPGQRDPSGRAWRAAGGERDPARLARLAALAAAAPVLWALSDLAVTGDALHSLTGTRDNAATLGRITGLDDVPLTVPRRLGEILREPVLVGAAGGGLLAWWLLRDRARLGVTAGIVALAAFCVLAAAGLPILGRYLLLPAALLAIFCGAGAFGWRELPRDHPRRRGWAWFGAATLALLAVFALPQADRLGALRDALARQGAIQEDLGDLVRRPPAAIRADCAPVTVPNHRPVPLLALWLDTAPREVVAAQVRVPARGTFVVPATTSVADDYVLDPRDRIRIIPSPPAGFVPEAANDSWRVLTRC
jgi:hypothetical protein